MTCGLDLYRVSQEEMSIFCEVIVELILNKNSVYVHMSYCERFPRQSYFTVQEFEFGLKCCPSLPPYCVPLDFCLWSWMKGKVYRT